jgi:hypothetical protein
LSGKIVPGGRKKKQKVEVFLNKEKWYPTINKVELQKVVALLWKIEERLLKNINMAKVLENGLQRNG